MHSGRQCRHEWHAPMSYIESIERAPAPGHRCPHTMMHAMLQIQGFRLCLACHHCARVPKFATSRARTPAATTSYVVVTTCRAAFYERAAEHCNGHAHHRLLQRQLGASTIARRYTVNVLAGVQIVGLVNTVVRRSVHVCGDHVGCDTLRCRVYTRHVPHHAELSCQCYTSCFHRSWLAG